MSARGMVPASMARRGLTLMIHIFLDDSGKESQSTNPWVCMAGYFADFEPLVELNGKWRQLLTRHGIREIHMKNLIPMEGIYKNLGWDTEKRDQVVSEFVQAINETRMYGVGIAVQTSTWQEKKKQYPDLKWGTVQQFCLERLLSRVVEQLHNAEIEDNLALVFDTDPEFGSNRFNLFCALMGHDKRAAVRLSSITFGHPIYYPGLQAADLLVWETRKNIMGQEAGHAPTRRWKAMFDKIPNYHLEYIAGEQWNRETFEAKMPEIIEISQRQKAESAREQPS